MARKKAARAEAKPTPRRRSARNAVVDYSIPTVYQDMLAEAAVNNQLDGGRAVKRRRVEQTPPVPSVKPKHDAPSSAQDPVSDADELRHEPPSPAKGQQTVYDDLASSEESDVDFEDVDLVRGAESEQDIEQKDETLLLDLSRTTGTAGRPAVQRKKGVTTTEKRLRLDVHKWHILCLLLHARSRSRWCDSEEVQATLKPLIPRKLINLLHVDESETQFARNHAFAKAIEEIGDIWRREWSITSKGMRRPFWAGDADTIIDDDDEDPIDLDDFKEAAHTMSGSRDLGAQLFCALLRSVAVETRLVCSLQLLPFSGVAKGKTPEKPRPQYIQATSLPYQHAQQNFPTQPSAAKSSNPRWRLSEYADEPTIPRSPAPKQPVKAQRRYKESPYPIFWTEVFSPAIDKWIPVDPLVRQTYNRPRTGFEPPASDSLNSMSYVLAFEDDGFARDVTRRYTSHYNAKTRKSRVESTKDGEKWWKRTMRSFKRPFEEPRDSVEDNELSTREAQEGMPKSVADFKGHPVFALERHLRRNEVVWPLREVGKIGGTSGAKVEPVYRRTDVHVVRSADQWYRKGRDVKMDEQPLKRAVVARKKDMSVPLDEEEADEEAAGTTMYAEFQTDVYVPPGVVDGRIPRNVYGNLDVYVPSMIPAGAIHVQHPEAARAAKILGVNYADAVTGFQFKGRHGTAVVNGIVAAAGYREALVEVINGIQNERVAAEQEKRTMLALQMWKRFMTALRIKERIDTEYADAGSDEEMKDGSHQDESDGDSAGGGFMPEAATDTSDVVLSAMETPTDLGFLDYAESPAIDVIVIESPHKKEIATEKPERAELSRYDSLFDDPDTMDYGGNGTGQDTLGNQGEGFIPTEVEELEGGGFLPENGENDAGGGFMPDAEDVQGGGFLPEEGEEATGGGFILEETEHEHGEDFMPADDSGADNPDSQSGGGFIPVAPNATAVEPDAPSTVKPTASNESAVDVATGTAKTEKQPPSLTEQLSASSSSGSDIQRGSQTSLLSHDPEDEDAEPEWLVDEDD